MPKLVPMGRRVSGGGVGFEKEVDLAACGFPEAYDLIAGKKLRVIGY
jgi:hypothetical protein